MIYTFDKNSLEFKKIRYVNVAKRYVLPLLIIIPLLSISIVSQHEYEDVVYVQVDKKTFNEENLKQMIYNMNLKFPHIAMAQAILESNNFKSNIFNSNNNLFGMKEARVRVNLATGTKHGHATYDTWEHSVLDYAFWVASYARECRTEQEFYTLLSKYAEDRDYETKLKRIVSANKLKRN